MSIEIEPLACLLDAEIVHSAGDARRLLRASGEPLNGPFCWIANGPVPGEPPFCRTPRILINTVFGRSPALGLDSPDAGQVK